MSLFDTTNLLDCPICLETYSSVGDHLPRVCVPCGHTVCNLCGSDETIRKCPICRMDLLVEEITRTTILPVNYSLIAIIDSLTPAREKTPTPSDPVSLPVPTVALQVKSASIRQTHTAAHQDHSSSTSFRQLEEQHLLTPAFDWSIRIRRERSIDSDVLGLINNGQSYRFSKIEGMWAKLSPSEYSRLLSTQEFIHHNPEEEGWCLLRGAESGREILMDFVGSFAMTPGRGWNVRIRREKSINSEVVGIIQFGTVFSFLRINGNWAKLSPLEYPRVAAMTDSFKPHNLAVEGWCMVQSDSKNDHGNDHLLEYV